MRFTKGIVSVAVLALLCMRSFAGAIQGVEPEAVSGASTDTRIDQINAIGSTPDADAVPLIAPFLNDPDARVAEAAASALGRIGGDTARDALARARGSSSASGAVDHALLECAGGYAAAGQPGSAAPIYGWLLTGAGDASLKAAALNGLIGLNPEQGPRLLFDALHSESEALFQAALIAARDSASGAAVTAELANSVPVIEPERAALVLEALADRGDATALPAARTAVKHSDERVRAAALRAIGVLGVNEQTREAALLAEGSLPDGHRVAAYLDCGAQAASTNETGPRITSIAGESHTFAGVDGPLATAAFAADQVEYEISGLAADGQYVLGFAWWDADGGGRRESVRFGVGDPLVWTTVLPATRVCAFYKDEPTWARILLPLSGDFAGKDRVRVAFAREDGPNAVVNEMWLFEKTAPEPRKRVLIVTGDDYPGHLWRETAPEFAAILREDKRFEVSINESPAIFGSPLLDHYDAAVLHFKNYSERLVFGPEIWSGLDRYIASGHGLVIAHFGCGAFQEWSDYVKVAGRIWNPEKRAHDPYGKFQVRVVDAAHAVTNGMADFDTEDELYTCLDGSTPIHVLCEATSKVDQEPYPMAFVVGDLAGRVLHCPLGHDVNALRAPGTRDLYRRATAWAAGL